MREHNRPLYVLIQQIRGAFHELGALSDSMNSDVWVTAAMRAVIETLSRSGPQTVPQIANAKTVSRQHIQVLADALAKKNFIQFLDNPGHKRSKLVSLTSSGARVFGEIIRREEKALKELTQSFDNVELAITISTIEKLRGAIRTIE